MINRKLLKVAIVVAVSFIVWNEVNVTTTESNTGRAITYSSYINIDGNVVSLDEFKGSVNQQVRFSSISKIIYLL